MEEEGFKVSNTSRTGKATLSKGKNGSSICSVDFLTCVVNTVSSKSSGPTRLKGTEKIQINKGSKAGKSLIQSVHRVVV